MTQNEKRTYLLKNLLNEQPQYSDISIPYDEYEQKRLLRSLFNIRMPANVSDEFLKIQDSYLKEEISRKGITDIKNLKQFQNNIYLWQGDITTLKCDAIVNAANNQMLGCFCPCHECIDNAIHTFAGIQLRLSCYEQMKKQRHKEKTGSAKITPAFNLPCKYILHTVGPIVLNSPTKKDVLLLASCYNSCLELAESNNIKSIAFCCISTGEFHFPNELAAKIAINTVKEYLNQKNSKIEVIFNVFKDVDYKIYKKLLQSD